MTCLTPLDTRYTWSNAEALFLTRRVQARHHTQLTQLGRQQAHLDVVTPCKNTGKSTQWGAIPIEIQETLLGITGKFIHHANKQTFVEFGNGLWKKKIGLQSDSGLQIKIWIH